MLDSTPGVSLVMATEQTIMNSPLPLARLTVIDLTLARAGPTCVRHLADWGANVIRVEPQGSGPEDITGARDGPDFQNLHRNKRTISINLKTPEGHAAFMRLVKDADVIVENMRVSVKHRLKVAWEDVRAVNPRIVYGSVSGFGQTGPYSSRAGVDQIAQGMGGLMSITGEPGRGPMRVGIAINDTTAGTLLALSIMMALYEREHTGVGRWVYTSLLEAQIFLLDFQAARWLLKGEVAEQLGNDHPTVFPTGVFETSDGMINISASGRVWERLCDALGKPEWKAREEWKLQAGRIQHRVAVRAAVADVIKTKPNAHWMDVLEASGVPCGPINTIDQVFADPQVQHLGMAMKVDRPGLTPQTLVASPLNMSGLAKNVRSAAPDPGRDTEQILHEAGYSAEEIAKLKALGVI